MVPASFRLVTSPCGHRRRRFMESADFNGAAIYLVDALRRAVADGRDMRAVFTSVEMNPPTPGVFTSAVTVSLKQKDIALATSGHLDATGSYAGAFGHLLGHPDTPADLGVYVGPEDAVGRELAGVGKQSVVLRLEIRSVDLAAVTLLRLGPEAPPARMAFAKLTFRGLLGA